MLDINLLRKELDYVATKLKNKKYILDKEYFLSIEARRKNLQIKTEELQAKRNFNSKQIGILKAQKQNTDLIMQEVAGLSEQLKSVQEQYEAVQTELTSWLSAIPNIPHDLVPEGLDETANQEIRKFSTPRNFDFTVEDHVNLGYAIAKGLDFEAGSKIASSRFAVLRGKIAKLHRILAQYMLSVHIEEHGYLEVATPYLVNSKSAFNTGQLPKFEEDLFKTKRGDEDMYLIPTAELPITNLVADEILKEADLPLQMVSHTPCFRSEAGSYGRDTRGLIRMHQFDKVELVHITQPKDSYLALETLTNHAEKILQNLDLPYRVMRLCGGDLGFGAAMTYDIEVWIPSQNTYREISSCSNMTDFQARRMQARFKDIEGKNQFVHTLNGSGLAVGRTLVAILENYQNFDGSINVPEVLQPLMGYKIIN